MADGIGGLHNEASSSTQIAFAVWSSEYNDALQVIERNLAMTAPKSVCPCGDHPHRCLEKSQSELVE